MRPELRAFAAADVEPAGSLLAQRHAAHRRATPLLAPRYEDPVAATAEVAAAWAADDASGAVAVGADGGLLGYLLGAPKAGAGWGDNVWIEAAGHALGAGVDAELARDLYGAAAPRWVAEGRLAQYVLLPAYDRALVDAWYRLAFGLQQVHAVRPPEGAAAGRGDGGPLIRRARREDIPALARLEIALPEHHAQAPVFSALEVPSLESVVADWEGDFDDPDYATFVAEVDGTVVGSAIGCSLEKSSSHKGLACPDHAGFLGFAAVLPSARGLGVGQALGETVLRWATDAGYASVVTDWRATNLLSSRTWPKLGFEPSFVRLHRLVGY